MARERWHPPAYDAAGDGKPNTYTQADIRAIQALAQYAQLAEVAWDEKSMGAPPPPPSPFEVKRALDWIVRSAAMTYDEPFEAGRPDASAYMMGRRAVGLAIIKLMALKAAVFDEKP